MRKGRRWEVENERDSEIGIGARLKGKEGAVRGLRRPEEDRKGRCRTVRLKVEWEVRGRMNKKETKSE